MPDRQIPDQVSEAMETIEEYTGVNVPKTTTKTTASAYTQAALAVATTLPLVLGNPVPTIGPQEPAKRPDEHQTSQTQHGPEVEIEEALVSGSPLDFRITAKSGTYAIEGEQVQLTNSSAGEQEQAPEPEA